MRRRVTFSRNFTLSLSRTCQCFCKYCAFKTHQAHLHEPGEVLGLLDGAAKRNVKELLVLTGERPEVNATVRERLGAWGHADFTSYVVWTCERALERGLLPHTNLGVLGREDLARLREVTASQGLMLESVRDDLVAHQGSPTKAPAARLACLRAAGELRIPFTSGILAGIGEDHADRIAALEALAAVHAEFGHLQEVILQNFVPHHSYYGQEVADVADEAAQRFWRTGLRERGGRDPLDLPAWATGVSLEEMEDLVVTARRVLPGVGVQVPPNLADWWPQLVAAGATDLGGLSANGDHISPEHPFPSPHQVRRRLQGDGVALTERLCAYPQYLDADWVAQGVLDVVKARYWTFIPRRGSGRQEPPFAIRAELVGPAVERARDGGRLSRRGGHGAAQRDAPGGDRGDPRGRRRAARRARGGDGDVRRQPQHQRLERLRRRLRVLRLRPGQALARRLRALRGGVPPPRARGGRPTARPSCACSRASTRTGAWRTTSAGCASPARRRGAPGADLHLHAYSPMEVAHMCDVSGLSADAVFARLRDAGLGSTPGTAAEVLHDGVRERISPNKLPVARWVEVIEASHRAGLRSTSTVMFGHVEEPWELAEHLRVVRELQERTGGITEFVPLSFIPFQTLLGRTHGVEEISREENLRHTAVFRLALGGTIPSLQASWVKIGLDTATEAPAWGVNDLGGTLMEESISRMAGSYHGVRLDPPELIARRARRAGRRRPSARRSTTCAGAGPPARGRRRHERRRGRHRRGDHGAGPRRTCGPSSSAWRPRAAATSPSASTRPRARRPQGERRVPHRQGGPGAPRDAHRAALRTAAQRRRGRGGRGRPGAIASASARRSWWPTTPPAAASPTYTIVGPTEADLRQRADLVGVPGRQGAHGRPRGRGRRDRDAPRRPRAPRRPPGRLGVAADDADVDRLYGLPLERFVAERDALAKALRADGRREDAAAVKALAKPSVAAWAVNQAVRARPAEARALWDAGDALARAQEDLLAGRGDARALRDAARGEQAARGALVDAARGLLNEAGRGLGEDALERADATLHAAAVDQAARADVAAGRAAQERRHAGLGLLGGDEAPPPAPARRGRRQADDAGAKGRRPGQGAGADARPGDAGARRPPGRRGGSAARRTGKGASRARRGDGGAAEAPERRGGGSPAAERRRADAAERREAEARAAAERREAEAAQRRERLTSARRALREAEAAQARAELEATQADRAAARAHQRLERAREQDAETRRAATAARREERRAAQVLDRARASLDELGG